jgi:geranylgeranyl diphosphate synthase type II
LSDTNFNTFKDFVEAHRASIYNKICEYVPIKDPIEHYKIMRDYIDRQGKYRRPGLVLLTAYLYGATLKDAILPAAAEQLSEDWILMQDDIEDDADLRRGKPAAQKIYGWVHAMNASNTGQMAMWKMLNDYVKERGPERGGAVYDKFYDMLSYTVEGQYIENEFIHHVKDLSKVDESFYLRIADSKTCYYTVYGPMQIGALTGNGSETDLKILKQMGYNAGIAFQITDDILDMVADEKEFGKKNFGDIYEGKVTLIILHAYKNATKEEKAKIDAIYKKKRDDKTSDEINYIRSLIEKYDGIGYAESVRDKYGAKAKEAVEQYIGIMPENNYTKIVKSAVEEMFIRKK